MEIVYHKGKANVVADALSGKSVHPLCAAFSMLRLMEVVKKMGIHMIYKEEAIGDLILEPELYEVIRERQASDPKIQEWNRALERNEASRFELHRYGSLRFNGRWCVPNYDKLKKRIMDETHDTPYSIHPGGDKLYKDLKKTFWLLDMKKEVGEFVARCLACQK
ncbi:uncharacterized protein LOC141631359 [Silene latifolia]|uniref:uncharacterized protein LOC141631359 n=1 Tax=Silene latifolia TaxID=37657 RepID=UPI003D7779E4